MESLTTQTISNYQGNYQLVEKNNSEIQSVRNEIVQKNYDKSIIAAFDAAFDSIKIDDNGVATNQNKMAKDLSSSGLLACLSANLDMLVAMVQYKNLFGSGDEEIARNKRQFMLLLVENVLQEHRTIRVLEIREVFKRGGNKKYLENNFFTISPAEINRWMEWYKTERGQALKLYHEFLQSQKEAKERDTVLKLSQANDVRKYCQLIYEHRKVCINEYLPMGEHNSYAIMMFSFLWKSKIIVATSEYCNEVLDKEVLAVCSHLVYKKTFGKVSGHGDLDSEGQEFIKLVKNKSNVAPRLRITMINGSYNSYYDAALNNTRATLFQEAIMSKTIAEWQKILNDFLKKNNYEPL